MRPHRLNDDVITPLSTANVAADVPATCDERVLFGYDPDADGSYFPDPEDYPSVLDQPSSAAAPPGTPRRTSDPQLPGSRRQPEHDDLSPLSAEPAPAAVAGRRGYLVTITTTLLGLAAVVIIAFAASMNPPTQTPPPTAPAAPAAGNQNAANPPADAAQDNNQDTVPEPTDAADPSTTTPAATDHDPSLTDQHSDEDDHDDDAGRDDGDDH